MPSSSPPRRFTVRLASAAHEMIDTAARVEGVSLAQYVREAALMRVAWEAGVRAGATHYDEYVRWTEELARIRAILELAVSENGNEQPPTR